jgi:hypothetical protein
MEILEDNEFQIIIWDNEFKMMHTLWKPASENMDEEQYKTQTTLLIDLAFQYKTQKFLSDRRKSNMIISVELMEWTNQQYSSLKKFLKKSAILRPSDIVSNISIELSVEEKPISFDVQFFDNETKARDWLLG